MGTSFYTRFSAVSGARDIRKEEDTMNNLTEREIVDLANKCATRVCTTDNHHGCPYGDDGIMDCVERLASDYDATIDRLLDMADRAKKAGL